MKLLLDTHILLWLIYEPRRIAPVRDLIGDAANRVHVSLATWWEIAIRTSLGKLAADIDILRSTASDGGIIDVPIEWTHVRKAASLPRHHGDPFDHLLVAQAITEGMRLLTADRALVPYSELVWCIH